jgi:hypothetical protein
MIVTSTHPDYDTALPAWLPASVKHIANRSSRGWRDGGGGHAGKSEARVFGGRQKEKWQRVAARGSYRRRVAVVRMPPGLAQKNRCYRSGMQTTALVFPGSRGLFQASGSGLLPSTFCFSQPLSGLVINPQPSTLNLNSQCSAYQLRWRRLETQ